MKTRTLYTLVSTLACTCMASAGLLSDALNFGDGHRQSEWYGNFHDGHYPWIYHSVEGWQYLGMDTVSGAWMYDTELGWYYMQAWQYPHVYNYLSGWTTFMEDQGDRRQYYLHSINRMGDDRPIDPDACGMPVPKDPGEENILYYAVNNGSPLDLSEEGMDLAMTVTDYSIRMGRTYSEIQKQETLLADLDGTMDIEGSLYDVAGSAAVVMTDYMQENAMGRYVMHSVSDFSMNMLISGVMFDFVTTSHFRYPQQPLWFQLSRDDLCQQPVGTVIEQTAIPAVMETTDRIYVDGDLFEEESYSDHADILYSLEILDQLDTYLVRGNWYNDVVLLQETIWYFYQPYGYDTVTSTYWVVPGVGIIKSEAYDYSLANTILLELTGTGG